MERPPDTRFVWVGVGVSLVGLVIGELLPGDPPVWAAGLAIGLIVGAFIFPPGEIGSITVAAASGLALVGFALDPLIRGEV